MPQGQRVVAFEEEEAVLIRQDGEGEGALQFLRHGGQGGVGDLPGLLQQLHRHIGVGLHPAAGQAVDPAKGIVIVEYAVVGQGEGGGSSFSREGVVVLVLLLAALGGHPGVAHEDLYLPGETKGKPPGGTAVQLPLGPAAEFEELLPVLLKEVQHPGNGCLLVGMGVPEGLPTHVDMEAAGAGLVGKVAHADGLPEEGLPGHLGQW